MKRLICFGILVAIAAYFAALHFGGSKKEPFTYPNSLQWGKSKHDETITPFSVNVDAKTIDDLKKRLAQWRRHEPLQNVGYSYGLSGVPLDKLVKYWRENYDWTKAQTKLNSLPQFTTVVQGLKIHFLHAKGDPKATKLIPLLLVHGWPGSVVEFYRAIPLLTKADKDGLAFDVVAPSIPGFGFSEAASKPGFNPIAAAQIFHSLMQRLGYSKFVYQGGDWGSIIGGILSRIYPDSVIGYHSNFVMPPTHSIGDKLHLAAAMAAPNLFLDESDVAKLDKLNFKDLLEETGYFHEQGTKPDTLGVGISDSPVGLAAWIVEKFVKFTQRAEFKGDPAGMGISNDDLLTNVMIYWLTNHATSAARLYKETVQTMEELETYAKMAIPVPTGVACYPLEGLCSPKALLKGQMPKLVHYVDIARGGHFAAFEEPELFAQDVREAVRSFIEAREKEEKELAKKQWKSKESLKQQEPSSQQKQEQAVKPPAKPKEQERVMTTTTAKLPTTSTTMKPPTTTQAPPTTTQKPPVTTTQQAKPVEQKVTTTAKPASATQPPSTTQAPPTTTKKPPVTTTQQAKPVQQKVTTTAKPASATQPPSTTQAPPTTMQKPPVTTTQQAKPVQQKVTTTAKPASATQPPSTTQAPPTTTQKPPVTTTQAKPVEQKVTTTTTAKPPTTSTTMKPPSATQAPPTTTQKPPVTTTQAKPVEQKATTTAKPGSTTQQPSTTQAPPKQAEVPKKDAPQAQQKPVEQKVTVTTPPPPPSKPVEQKVTTTTTAKPPVTSTIQPPSKPAEAPKQQPQQGVPKEGQKSVQKQEQKPATQTTTPPPKQEQKPATQTTTPPPKQEQTPTTKSPQQPPKQQAPTPKPTTTPEPPKQQQKPTGAANNGRS